MTLKKLARQLKIPLQALKRMVEQGLISNPPTKQEINNLSFLSNFWGKKEWIQVQLTKFSHRKRKSIIETVGMDKIDAYIFNRYFFATKRLRVDQVATEVSHYYNIPDDDRLKKHIYRIREKARKAKQRVKKLPSKRCQNCPYLAIQKSVKRA